MPASILPTAFPAPAAPLLKRRVGKVCRTARADCRTTRANAGASSSGPAVDRRLGLATLAGAVLLAGEAPASAVQGSIAGRVPGITGPDSEGYNLYTRPEAKSGGHGVGWSEIPRYSFRVPSGWAETPVSIADLGGTEIDLRYGQADSGSLIIVVAPVLRFADVGYNANVRIDQLGPPDRIINGFAPELFGKPLVDGDVLNTQTVTKDGVLYYQWELKPHHLVAATAVGNRMFILATTSNSRQWRKAEEQLRVTQQSFKVPKA